MLSSAGTQVPRHYCISCKLVMLHVCSYSMRITWFGLKTIPTIQHSGSLCSEFAMVDSDSDDVVCAAGPLVSSTDVHCHTSVGSACPSGQRNVSAGSTQQGPVICVALVGAPSLRWAEEFQKKIGCRQTRTIAFGTHVPCLLLGQSQ